MWEVFVSRLSFHPDAVVGVSLIGIYFLWIIKMAVTRIFNGDHLSH
jgi:hypothetical protein